MSMTEFEKPKIERDETRENYGRYVVEPLERGFGQTLGNSLRRILLSSLPGYAATSVKIAGVQHEFSTVEHVKEDVTEIILNIKELIVRLHCDEDKLVTIEAEGPCEVKAGDIICVLGTGAYCNEMASNYNKQVRPGAVLVKDGKVREIIRRETYDDLLAREVY